MKDIDERIAVKENKWMDFWRPHDKISNQELTRDRNGLTDVSPVFVLPNSSPLLKK